MLLVAAGGGGDAITASVLATQLQLVPPQPILTYSWDRLVIDPVPGPRALSDFDGLDELAAHVCEVLPTTVARPPAGSTLPRLAADLPARVLLLDPSDGATGMAEQIRAAAQHFGTKRLGLVDVGGDVLANGEEPGLRSPLADMLALAACTLTGLPCQLFVVAPGIDGELDEKTVLQRLDELNARRLGALGQDRFQPVRQVFGWHPSEATGLLAAAANGRRGWVETRDAASRVHLTDDTAVAYAVDAYKAARTSPATLLRATRSLVEAARVTTEATGLDELGYETDKATRIRRLPDRQPTIADLAVVDDHAVEAAGRGTDYITIRRLAELAGVTTPEGLTAFQRLLADERATHYVPPLYATADPE